MEFTKKEITSQYIGIAIFIVAGLLFYFSDKNSMDYFIWGFLSAIAILTLCGWNKLFNG